MSPESKPIGAINPAEKLARYILHNAAGVVNDIWPTDRTKEARDHARSLQTKTVLAGGVAVFAYIFARSDMGKEALGKIQERAFKAGVVLRNGQAIEFAGEFIARKTGRSGESTILSVETEHDISEEALRLLEQGIDEFSGHEETN